MKTAIILHGTLGSPEGNWFKWLEHELIQKGFVVWLPQLPNPEQPCLSEWQRFVQDQCPFSINEETIVIGHSSGAILALIVAQSNSKKLGAVVGVSVFHDNSLQWQPNDKLFDIKFDWGDIHEGANKLVFIHSDNDPYVPLDQAKYVAAQTGGEMIVIPGEGHFNLERSESYSQFPKLLEILTEKELI